MPADSVDPAPANDGAEQGPDDALSGALEIRIGAGLLDEPLRVRLRGAGPDEPIAWSARLRDDDTRIWTSTAGRGEDLGATWNPAKASTPALAALQSGRPVSIDLRAQTADGRTAARTVTRALAADGVRQRRWRDGLAAALHIPADGPRATVLIDATAGADAAAVAALAAPLLASRGVLGLVVTAARGKTSADAQLVLAAERLAAVPGATAPVTLTARPLRSGEAAVQAVLADLLGVPPCVPVRESEAPGSAPARAAAWDALLARLHARPRSAGTN